MNILKNEEDFSSYLDLALSQESKDTIKGFFIKYPNIKKELFIQTKNAMASTIYKENQSRDYIKGVMDTLKYLSRHF